MQDLPSDILLSICSFLEPPEILRFGRTCKDICNLTHEKSVWADILHRHCEDDHLTLPIPITPSTTCDEVKRAATSSYRFAAQLSAGGEACPSSTRTLSAKSCVVGSVLEGVEDPLFSSLRLITGGRYLFTIIKCSLVQLWDLSSREPSLLASLYTGDEKHANLSGGLGRDGELVIAALVAKIGTVPLEFCYRIYKCQPVSGQGEFITIAELPVDLACLTTRFLGLDARHGCALIASRGVVMIWDYESDSLASMKLHKDTSVVKATLCRNHIAIWDSNRTVSVYTIPPFRPRSEKRTSRLPHYMPVVQFRPGHSRTRALSSFIWDSDNQELQFDVIDADDTQSMSIRSYKCTFWKPMDDAVAIPMKPVLLRTLCDDNTLQDHSEVRNSLQLEHLLQSMRLPSRAALLWFGDKCVKLTSLTDNNATVTLWKSTNQDHVAPYLFSFCPYAGRACAITGLKEDTLENGAEIQIVDYV